MGELGCYEITGVYNPAPIGAASFFCIGFAGWKKRYSGKREMVGLKYERAASK